MLAKRLLGKGIPEMIYLESSGTLSVISPLVPNIYIVSEQTTTIKILSHSILIWHSNHLVAFLLQIHLSHCFFVLSGS